MISSASIFRSSAASAAANAASVLFLALRTRGRRGGGMHTLPRRGGDYEHVSFMERPVELFFGIGESLLIFNDAEHT